jgi:hypothetical protein
MELAVGEAVRRLEASGCSPEMSLESLRVLAEVWNGSSRRQSGAAMSYVDALLAARRALVASRLLWQA